MGSYGQYFIYDGKSSEEFDIVIAGLQKYDTPLNLSRDVSQSTINRYRTILNTYGVKYTEPLSFNLQLMKDPCKYTNMDELRFTRQEIRDIAAWLTSPITPRLFHMYDFPRKKTVTITEEETVYTTDPETGEDIPLIDGETDEVVTRTVERTVEVDDPEEEYDYFGLFTNMTSQDNQIYVLNCTFTCNSPYALSYEQSVVIDNGEGIVPNPSDDFEDYVYPTIIITPTDSEASAPYDIRLINESDENRYITLKNMNYLDTVIMDCRKMTVKNESGSLISFEDLNVDVVDYIYWFRLLNGDNSIKISGDASVEFIYRYPVKVGAY